MQIKDVLEHKWLTTKGSSRVIDKKKSIKMDGGSDFQAYTSTVVDSDKTLKIKK